MAGENNNGNGGKTIKEHAIEWLFKQGFAAVLLSYLVHGGLQTADYAVREGIPAAVKMIQAGYDRDQTVYKDSLHDVLMSRSAERREFIEAMHRDHRAPGEGG